MKIKRTLKVIAEKLTGTYILLEPPFGFDIAHDISKRFDGHTLNVIFDIGANIGQSALQYHSAYPRASVYCFEPIEATFQQLEENVRGKTGVQCFNYALGESVGEGAMTSEGTSTLNRLVENSGDAKSQNQEVVKISTVDEFCRSNSIGSISYLKIDTEGADLSVLKGATDSLGSQAIDFVEVEAGMSPNNELHVPLEVLKAFLEKHNYFIFGMYEQKYEWKVGKPNLRRTNLVFVSEEMINKHTGNQPI